MRKVASWVLVLLLICSTCYASIKSRINPFTGKPDFYGDTVEYLTSLAGALLATGATTGATSQAQVFTKGMRSTEYDNGNVSGTATIDWAQSNRQYATMTADTTFTFSNMASGQALRLYIAGAFTPTLPATTVINWIGTAPTGANASGKKYVLVCDYSAVESRATCSGATGVATT